jgi:hypothetical protein
MFSTKIQTTGKKIRLIVHSNMSAQPQFSEQEQRELASFLEAENAKARIQVSIRDLDPDRSNPK